MPCPTSSAEWPGCAASSTSRRRPLQPDGSARVPTFAAQTIYGEFTRHSEARTKRLWTEARTTLGGRLGGPCVRARPAAAVHQVGRAPGASGPPGLYGAGTSAFGSRGGSASAATLRANQSRLSQRSGRLAPVIRGPAGDGAEASDLVIPSGATAVLTAEPRPRRGFEGGRGQGVCIGETVQLRLAQDF